MRESPADMEPVNVFISYSHKDEALRKKLQEHLSSLGSEKFVNQWYDRRIAAGEDWRKKIDAELNKAHIILLLISASFNNSGYCTGHEMKKALERHRKKQAVVIPIILRPVVWDNQPYAKFQALPRDGRSIIEARIRDRAYAEVTRGIRERILEFRSPTAAQLRAIPAQPKQPRGNRSKLQVVPVSQRAKRGKQHLQVTEKIGEGAFGTVWRAWNADLDRWEAVKVYRPEFAREQSKRARFLRGLKAQAKLTHPNIGTFYGYRVSPETLEVSMRLSEGVPLDEWVMQRPSPSLAQKVDVLAQVCEGVGYAHEHGVVHRDLKPSNIIVERRESELRPVIIDFDSAVLVDSAALTKTAEHVGTLGFIAPEVVKKGASLESRRSILADIYSLGALAYFTLVRERPTPADLSSRAIDRKVALRIPELDDTRRQFLVNVLAKATASESAARYETALELRDALRLCLPDSDLPEFDAELPFVKSVFERFDELAPLLRPMGFTNRRFDEYDQVGRYTRMKEGFTALALYDFDMKEFAAGFSFPTFRTWREFQESELWRALRKEFGKSMKFDPPNKAEEGGAFIWFNLTNAPRRDPKVTAEHLIESIERCLGVYAATGF